VSLTPSTDLSAAAWITTSQLPWHQLVTFGPAGFAAYARLRFVPDPTAPEQAESDNAGEDLDELAVLSTALHVLGEFTHTPEDLYFCMWDGWGTPVAGSPPLVTVPERSYFLFRGGLEDFDDWGSARMDGVPRSADVPPPAFIWPADHAWCIAFDVDPHYAGIGAAPESIARLAAHPVLDVVLADPSEQQPYYL
jgi:hypothetical protein